MTGIFNVLCHAWRKGDGPMCRNLLLLITGMPNAFSQKNKMGLGNFMFVREGTLTRLYSCLHQTIVTFPISLIRMQ